MGETTILHYTVGEFRGSFPEVPSAPGVNMEELRALDADPLFVTLPVIPEIGKVSGNGLLYDDALALSIEEQINTKRPGGRFGHLSKEQADTAYPIPEATWIGAVRDGSTLWAKAYFPPGAARDHVRRLKAVGGSIATSIWGKGDYEQVRAGVRRLTNFALESLDFAPPERAALGYRATPILTAEMQEETEMNKEQLIAELTVNDIPATLRQQIISAAGSQQGAADDGQAVAELRQRLTDSNQVIAELQTAVAESRRQQFETALSGRIADLTNWPVTAEKDLATLASLRRTIRARVVETLNGDRTQDKVEAVIETIWAELQPLAETLRDSLAGPAAVVASKVASKRPTLEDTPEARAKARAEFAF